MVHLTITPAAKEAIKLYDGLGASTEGRLNGEPSLECPQVGDPVSHEQLIQIVRALNEEKSNGRSSETVGTGRIDLESLLRGANVYTAPPTPKQAPVSRSHPIFDPC